MPTSTRRLGTIGLDTLVLVLAAGLLASCGEPAPPSAPPATAPSRGAVGAKGAPAAATTQADLQRVKGRWQRQDGGYVLEIRAVRDDGELDASYLNPRPIRVFKAEASQDGAAVRVFVELRDVNYPGSTYDLRYDAKSDALSGIYFQAVEKQKFDVTFVRIP